MKKYIILTKDTAPLVLQRLQKMQHRKGKLTLNHTYTGAQEIYGYMKRAIGCTRWGLTPTVKAHTSYLKPNDCVMEIDNSHDMGLIRINWDKDKYDGFDYGSGMCIPYGTKMIVHSEKIQYKEKHVNGQGMITTIN